MSVKKFVNPVSIMNRPLVPAKPSDKPERMLPPEEFEQFFKIYISHAHQKLGILKVTKPYADDFNPKAFNFKLPQLLTSFYSSEVLYQGYLTIFTQLKQLFVPSSLFIA